MIHTYCNIHVMCCSACRTR